nr:DNA adenine methylase [Halobellus rarus]
MPDAVFPFPGGKSRLSSWILDHVPEHTCFVEVFGGAAGVLVNKDPSTSDVEGCWLCSYAELPDGMNEFYVSGRDEQFLINNGKSGSTTQTREHLVTNFQHESA